MSDYPIEQPLSLMQIDHCVSAASRAYHGVSPLMLKTLLAVEGGRIGTIRKNSDKSFDLGPMQINTIHLKDIAREHGITARQLVYDPCKNIMMGAWLLWRHLRDADGHYWLAMGNYHSKTPAVRKRYLHKVAEAYANLLAGIKSGKESQAIGRTTNWGGTSPMAGKVKVPSLDNLEAMVDSNQMALTAPISRSAAKPEPPKPRVVTIENRRKTLRFID